MIICNLCAAIRIYANQQGERPSRGPLRDREIFVKVRLKLYSYCILLLSSITACYSVRRLQCKVVTSLLSSDTDKWGHFIVSSINANIIFTTIHYPPSAMLPHATHIVLQFILRNCTNDLVLFREMCNFPLWSLLLILLISSMKLVMEVAAAVHMRAAVSDGLQLKGTFVLALRCQY